MNDSKWWAGIKGGIDFSSAHPSIQYSAFENITAVTGREKKYSPLLKGRGPVIGFTLDYAVHPNLAISIQPSFQAYYFSYSASYIWHDTAASTVSLTNTHHQRMQYLELPLMIKGGYSFGKIRLMVQAGAYYGTKIFAAKTVSSQEISSDSNSLIALNSFSDYFNLKKQYIPSQIGIIAGGGIAVDVNYFRLALEVNYRMGLNNITSQKERYSDHRMISGVYDVPDNLKLSNLEVVLHCSTPLDYLMHMPGFSAKPARRK